jgi:hypothetical protein
MNDMVSSRKTGGLGWSGIDCEFSRGERQGSGVGAGVF